MYRDLIEQADTLARLGGQGAPRQANLRRAVSSAYYAVFHYLVDAACRAILGTQHAQQAYRYALSRAFVHATMKAACSSFAGTQLPEAVAKPLPKDATGRYSIAPEIQQIAALFKELQQKRYLADYDLSERFKRSEVLTLIEQVAQQIENFGGLPASNDRQFFLVSLLVWKELSNR